MNERPDCLHVQDRLADLAAGRSAGEEERSLRDHLAGCPDCSMLLRIHREMESLSRRDLEAEAPEALVAGMWERVEAVLPAATPQRGPARKPWLGPALAASIGVLLAGLLFTAGELRSAYRHRQFLEQRIAAQEDLLRGLVGTGAGEDPAPVPRILSLLEGRTVSQAVTLLRALPPDAVVLSRPDAETLALRLRRWGAPADIAPAAFTDGLQAREAVRVIESLGLDPDERIPRTRLLILPWTRGALEPGGPRS